MELTREVQKRLATKVAQARMRLLCHQPFYGLLILYMEFSLDPAAETAYTDGERIAFDPGFLDSLSDRELDFILMHEVLHAALCHTQRGRSFEDHDAFNIAADIVVNSNILKSMGMDTDAITLAGTGESVHNLPDGREGYEFSAEELYPVVKNILAGAETSLDRFTSRKKQQDGAGNGTPWDNHDKWDESNEENSPDAGEEEKDLWIKRMADATNVIETMAANITHDSSLHGTVPAFMERILKELRESKLDWRTVLQNFVQEEVTDYSFSPPDKRFDDSPFFLPDFNEKDQSVQNVLFMVDTSGSMSDDMILEAFSEVKGALDQFNGKLAGYLGFFDAVVYEPKAFDDIDSLLDIKPKGGGGTDFGIIFDYVREHMEEPPVSIIILTDGYAPIPDESAAMGIPVLWVINNEKVTPKWGKIAKIA